MLVSIAQRRFYESDDGGRRGQGEDQQEGAEEAGAGAQAAEQGHEGPDSAG